MRVRGARGWIAALVVGGLVAAACGLEKNRAASDELEDTDEFSERLYDGGPDGSIWSALDDSERDAVERSGMSGLSASAADEEVDAMDEADQEGKADKASKLTLSVLVVAISAAAAAAPFLLF